MHDRTRVRVIGYDVISRPICSDVVDHSVIGVRRCHEPVTGVIRVGWTKQVRRNEEELDVDHIIDDDCECNMPGQKFILHCHKEDV